MKLTHLLTASLPACLWDFPSLVLIGLPSVLLELRLRGSFSPCRPQSIN